MLKQINILLDPLGSGGGGVTTVGNPTTGQSLSGTLSEDNSDNDTSSDSTSDNGNDNDNDNIFDLNQFKSNDPGETTTKEKTSKPSKDNKSKTTKEDDQQTGETDKQDGEEEEVILEEEDENNQQQKQGDKKQQDKRDYTGFSKEDVEYLKKLPNGVYNQVVPVLKRLYAEQESAKTIREEHKKFKEDPNRIPDSWYEHAEAYQLSPEFKKLSDTFSKAEFEANHWEQQLYNLKAHKAYIPLQGYDSKTGEYKFGPQVDVDDNSIARLEIQMQQLINKANITKQNLNSEAVKIQNEFKNSHSAINGYYDKADEMIKTTLPEQFRPKDDHMKKFEAVLHPSHRGTSIGKLAGKLYSIIINQGVALAEYAKRDEVKHKNNLDNKAAGPKSSKNGKLSSKSVNGDDNESIDLDKLKQEMES